MWQSEIRGEIAKSAAVASSISISTRAMQSMELIQALLKGQKTLQNS